MVEDAISFWTDIQRYEDMLVADPRSYCFAPLSELYRKLGLLDDAISVAKKGCQMHPDYHVGFFALGAACHAKGLMAEAREALERVVLLDPDHLEARKLLGGIYVEAGEIAKAERMLEQVLRQNPDDLEISLLLHSVASRGASQQEELLEEADLIEELTEVLQEPPAAERGAPTEPSGLSEEAPAPRAGSPRFAPLRQAEDLWEIGAPDDSELDLSRVFEEAEELEELTEPEPFRAPEPWQVRRPELPGRAEPSELSGLSEASAPKEAPGPADLSEATGFSELIELADSTGSGQPSSLQQQCSRDPLATATLAELYVTQGIVGKALTIYRELLASDPANQSYRSRCGELEDLQARQREERQKAARPVEAPARQQAEASQQEVEAELCRWLENIRRIRDGV